MMADSITVVSIITLVDQFHLAARSARMLPMRSSSAPIRQHLQSAIQQTQENRPLFRLFPVGDGHDSISNHASFQTLTPPR